MYLIFSVSFFYAASQNTGIGMGTVTPHPSAALEIKDSARGFLPPRMTFAQRNSIVNPGQGLIIYCTDCGSNGGEPQYYNGQQWLNLNGGIAQVEYNFNSGVKIGNQTWSVKNLDVSRYRNGDPIPHVTDTTQWLNLTTGAWCWYNNDSATYAATYGRLYNWYAVADSCGLCPLGWHVPSVSEWQTLIDFTGGVDSHIALKEAGVSHWRYPNQADNLSGFTALPGGYRYGYFYDIHYVGYWWTSTPGTNPPSPLAHYATVFLKSGANTPQQYARAGFSVRCIKD